MNRHTLVKTIPSLAVGKDGCTANLEPNGNHNCVIGNVNRSQAFLTCRLYIYIYLIYIYNQRYFYIKTKFVHKSRSPYILGSEMFWAVIWVKLNIYSKESHALPFMYYVLGTIRLIESFAISSIN